MMRTHHDRTDRDYVEAARLRALLDAVFPSDVGWHVAAFGTVHTEIHDQNDPHRTTTLIAFSADSLWLELPPVADSTDPIPTLAPVTEVRDAVNVWTAIGAAA